MIDVVIVMIYKKSNSTKLLNLSFYLARRIVSVTRPLSQEAVHFPMNTLVAFFQIQIVLISRHYFGWS